MRLFVAIELPDTVKQALGTIQDQLKRDTKAVSSKSVIRWTSIESIHLTLKFLGEVNEVQRSDIEDALVGATMGIKPFELTVSSTGGFPNLNKPRVLWVGCSGDLETLHTLRDAVEHTISPLGFPTETRPFSPHLTIGRAVEDARSTALASVGEQVSKLNATLHTMTHGSTATWKTSEVSLMLSELKPSGSVYTSLYKAPLK